MSAYYTRIGNLIDQIADEEGAVTHINEESVRATGVELEAEGRWSSGVQVRASVSFQNADNTEADETLSNAPHRLGTLHAAVPLWRRQLLLATEALFTSERRTVAGTALEGYGLLNVTLTSRPIGSRVSIGGSIYNVFDTSYLDPVGVEFVQWGIPQDGRTASVRVSLRF
jgi:outer membrane cobalamin receptor